MSANLVWRRKKLPNGLTILQYPRQSNTAQLALSVKYGSNQEPKDAAGIAHFLEHMLAGGSEQRIKRSRGVEDFGGVLDFYTDREQVSATVDVRPEKVGEASTVLSELFFDDRFDQEKVDLERKIILNELAEVADDPTVKVEELLLENLFKRHPIRRPVGGYPRTVKKLTLDQLVQAHRENYVPQNMILVVSGNISEKNLDNIQNAFKTKKSENEPPKDPQPNESAKPKAIAVEEKAGITQTYVSIGARIAPASSKDAPAMDLIGTLLGGGTSSRLFIELREKNAVTYDVGAAYCKGADFGYISVNCAVSNRKVNKAQDIILKEIAKLRTEIVPADELCRAKQIWLGSAFRGMDNPHDTLEIITYMEMQFGNEMALADYVAKIKAVTDENIREAAEKYLKEDCLCTAVLKPT